MPVYQILSRTLLRARLAALTLLSTALAAAPLAAQSLYFPPDSGSWETVNPEQVGWSSTGLAAALQLAAERDSTGVVILYQGRILAEGYWDAAGTPDEFKNFIVSTTPDGRTVEDVASAQKSVAAILTGIAQEKGLVRLDETVSHYLGAGWSKASSEQEQQITLRHLLTMTSGLADDLSFQAAAGSQWRYNTPAYHFVMRVLESASGMERNDLTKAWLTGPLGLSNTSWVPRPWASADIGVGLATTARELARFGLMIAANGRWQDQVILGDREYLQAMLHPSQTLNPSYGYLWWLNGQEFTLGAGPRAPRSDGSMIPSAPDDLVAMQGAMDRKLYLVPSLNLVVTRLGAAGNADGKAFNDAFWEALMAARLH